MEKRNSDFPIFLKLSSKEASLVPILQMRKLRVREDTVKAPQLSHLSSLQPKAWLLAWSQGRFHMS